MRHGAHNMLAADGPRVYLLRKAAGLSSFLPAAEWERKDIMEQPEIKVIEVPTGDLVPYANNAKLHSQLQVEQIANSIEEFGFNDPIAVWENADGAMEVVEGHGRVLAAQKLGLDKVPVFYLNHLTDEQRRAYTHVHNQTTLSSGFDIDILDQEIELLDFDWESFGFETEEEPDYGLDMNIDGVEGRESSDCKLRVDGETFLISEDEAEMLSQGLRAWMENTGYAFGYIRSLYDRS